MEPRDCNLPRTLDIPHPSLSSQDQYSCFSPSALCRYLHSEVSDNALCLPSVISPGTERTASHVSSNEDYPHDGSFDMWRREIYDWSVCFPNESAEGRGHRQLCGDGADNSASSSRLSICHYTTSCLDANRKLDTFANGLSLSLSSKPQPPRLKRGREASDFWTPSVYGRRSSGPLGPLTGYETILKSSVFLKPAQQLLDELPAISSPECLRNPSASSPEDDVKFIEITKESHQPVIRLDYQRTKTKLLNLHNEVFRQHKLYRHQIQVAMSSFEVVAGLVNASPFASLAVKEVSGNFRTIQLAIDDHLKHVAEVVGDDIQTKEIKSNINHKPKLSLGQQVWRSQRGLPEHAVTVLRAWLFEHFLHPYPTDNDKVMLATQTGISRNQVSNWFINARVRLWKPMVEEMHILETKGMSESDQSITVSSGICEGSSRSKSDRSLTVSKRSESPQLTFGLTNELHHELAFDGSMSCLKPDGNGGIGAVSLTLGLQQGVDRHFYHPHMQGHGGLDQRIP